MKKLFIVLAIATLTFAFGSCREKKEDPPATHTKEVIREVPVKEEKEEPKKEGVLKRVGDKIDKKVEKKVDEKIDEID